MGLDIKKYSHSYSAMQTLRSAALKVEGSQIRLQCKDYGTHDWDIKCGKCFYCLYSKYKVDTKFAEFIWHSDCDNGYISKRSKQLSKYKDYGDLDKLKEECKILDKSIKNYLDEYAAKVWDNYYSDVKSSRMLLHYT